MSMRSALMSGVWSTPGQDPSGVASSREADGIAARERLFWLSVRTRGILSQLTSSGLELNEHNSEPGRPSVAGLRWRHLVFDALHDPPGLDELEEVV